MSTSVSVSVCWSLGIKSILIHSGKLLSVGLVICFCFNLSCITKSFSIKIHQNLEEKQEQFQDLAESFAICSTMLSSSACSSSYTYLGDKKRNWVLLAILLNILEVSGVLIARFGDNRSRLNITQKNLRVGTSLQAQHLGGSGCQVSVSMSQARQDCIPYFKSEQTKAHKFMQR